MKECLNCLQSTTGFCFLHKQHLKNINYTTTSNARKYSREEVAREVLHYAKQLCKLKWYQSKSWSIKQLKYWVEFLNQFDKK